MFTYTETGHSLSMPIWNLFIGTYQSQNSGMNYIQNLCLVVYFSFSLAFTTRHVLHIFVFY